MNSKETIEQSILGSVTIGQYHHLSNGIIKIKLILLIYLLYFFFNKITHGLIVVSINLVFYF